MIKDRFGTADGGELMKIRVDSNVAIAALIEEMENYAPTAGDSAKTPWKTSKWRWIKPLSQSGRRLMGTLCHSLVMSKALRRWRRQALAGIGEALADLFTIVMPEGGSQRPKD